MWMRLITIGMFIVLMNNATALFYEYFMVTMLRNVLSWQRTIGGAVLDEMFHLDSHMCPQPSVYESMTSSLAEEIEFLNQTIKSRRSIGDC